jgi:aerobic carbon-monoxide dehydrogenase large subunit
MPAVVPPPFIGRREDHRFLTGHGKYTGDYTLPGELHAAFRRAEMASARLTNIDIAAATTARGVHAVCLGKDFLNTFGTIEPAITFPGRGGARVLTPQRPLLASECVRFVGEEIAVVLADSFAHAIDAAERIEVEYEATPAVLGIGGALREGAACVHASVPGNICFDFDYGDEAATREALASATYRVDVTVDSPRVAAAPMEPRAVLAWYDAARGTYEIQCSNQGGDLMAVQLATLLRTTRDRIRVHPVDVGGGFGPRAGAYPEYAILLAAARRTGRPIRWTGTRSEDFLCDAHGRGIRLTGELGLDALGNFLALRTEWVCDQGAYLTYAGARTNTFNGYLIGAGPYRVPVLYGRHRLALTNATPTDAYRGAARPEAALIIEQLVDKAARMLGSDAIELRRRNVIRQTEFPWTNNNGSVYDSGDLDLLLTAVQSQSNWNAFPERAHAAAQRGALRGIGCAVFVEPCGGGFVPEDQVMLTFHEAGRIIAYVATTSNGQGHETVFPAIIAERLGVNASCIELRASDPDGPLLRGNGTIGSRSLLAQGSAFACAADEAIAKGTPIAARLLEAAIADIDFVAGAYCVRGTDLDVSFSTVQEHCSRADPHRLDTLFTQPVPRTFTTGAHVAEIEIDRDTGAASLVAYTAVDDIGRVINPALAHGQVHGGLAQVAGQIFGEQCRYDDNGQLLTGSFLDYTMPRADTLPNFHSTMIETPSTMNVLGAKGVGETGSTGGLPAMANALADALRRGGVEHFAMPAAPGRIWAALVAKRR